MTDYQRLEQLKKRLNLSYNAFSRELGLKSPQIFYDIKAGKCGISKDLAIKIQDKYCINITWLLTGEGEMLRKGNTGINNSVVVGVGENNHIFHGSPIEYKPSSDNDEVIAAGEPEIEHLNSILAEKNKLLEDRQTQHLKSILEEKDKLLAEKNKLLEEKERLIQILLQKNS